MEARLGADFVGTVEGMRFGGVYMDVGAHREEKWAV